MARTIKLIPAPSEKDKKNFSNKTSTIPSETGCLEWLAYRDKDGYGEFNVNRKSVKSHRFAYFLATGIDPKELQVHHSCNNPSCVNPVHLSLGTVKMNSEYMVLCGRSAKGIGHGYHIHPESWRRGITHWKAKLNEAQVMAIRADTRSHREIALDYKVARCQIGKIKNRQLWRHIT